MRYKGYYYDSETQMYYCKSRYYSPELCRWISGDSEQYVDVEIPNGLNLFVYCANDPINKIDLSGNFCLAVFRLMAVAAMTKSGIMFIVDGVNGTISATKACDDFEIEGIDKIGYTLTGFFVGNYCVVEDNWATISRDIKMEENDKTKFMLQDNEYYNFYTAHLYANHIYNNYYANRPELNRTKLGIYIELQAHYIFYLFGNSHAVNGVDMGKATFKEGGDSTALLSEIIAFIVRILI